MTVRGVIFDMGGTLLHYNAPGCSWEDTEKTGARGVYQCLLQDGYTLPPEAEALDIAWEHAEGMWLSLSGEYDVTTMKLTPQLRLLAERWGIENLPADRVAALSQAYMMAIQAHIYPLVGAVDVLQALRDQGLRVGLISNTVWPGASHQADLDRFDLTPYLEHIVFSADVEVWKPDRAIFQLGLNALELQPEETVYVGDSLYFDMWGAQQADMRGVWIKNGHQWLPDGLTVTPDATIQQLPDLLAILGQWI